MFFLEIRLFLMLLVKRGIRISIDWIIIWIRVNSFDDVKIKDMKILWGEKTSIEFPYFANCLISFARETFLLEFWENIGWKIKGFRNNGRFEIKYLYLRIYLWNDKMIRFLNIYFNRKIMEKEFNKIKNYFRIIQKVSSWSVMKNRSLKIFNWKTNSPKEVSFVKLIYIWWSFCNYFASKIMQHFYNLLLHKK